MALILACAGVGVGDVADVFPLPQASRSNMSIKLVSASIGSFRVMEYDLYMA
jgi:hypothetical protein